MYDADYEVRDSGKKAVYSDGNQRDDPGDKPRFDLLLPEGMPYEETLLYRTAMHYMRGGKKYGDRNWEKSSTQESLNAHKKALWRHFIKFVGGIEDGEDHAAAIVWNVQAVVYTQWRLKQRVDSYTAPVEVPALDDEENAEATGADIFPIKFSQVSVRIEGHTAREVNGSWIENTSPAPQTFCFPFAPGTCVSVGDSRPLYLDDAGRPLKCPAHGNEKCEACSQNPDPSRCQCGYFESAGMHWDTCPGRIRVFPAELNKMLGRETAEHSAELDMQQDVQMATGEDIHRVSGPPRPGVLNSMPCIQCGERKCIFGEGRCPDCQQKNITAGWQEKAAEIGGPCPDGGTCHHGCTEQMDWPCFRVLTCGPLSGVMPGDRWPPEVLQENHDKEASRLAAERERNRQA